MRNEKNVGMLSEIGNLVRVAGKETGQIGPRSKSETMDMAFLVLHPSTEIGGVLTE